MFRIRMVHIIPKNTGAVRYGFGFKSLLKSNGYVDNKALGVVKMFSNRSRP